MPSLLLGIFVKAGSVDCWQCKQRRDVCFAFGIECS